MIYLPKDDTPKSDIKCECGEYLVKTNGNTKYFLLKCNNIKCRKYAQPQGSELKDTSEMIDYILRVYK